MDDSLDPLSLDQISCFAEYLTEILSLSALIYQEHNETGSYVPVESVNYNTVDLIIDKIREIIDKRMSDKVSEAEKIKFMTWLLINFSCYYMAKNFPNENPLPAIIEQEIKYSFIKENPDLF